MCMGCQVLRKHGMEVHSRHTANVSNGTGADIEKPMMPHTFTFLMLQESHAFRSLLVFCGCCESVETSGCTGFC